MSVPATVTMEQAASRSWAAIVVGAGPAGAVVAGLIARAGVSVLLVDRATFPRTKVCGSCLNGRALAALAEAGLGELPGRLGAIPVRSFHLAAGKRSARLPLNTGVSLSREAFDAALIQQAIQRGADFLPATRADCPNENQADLSRRVCLQQPTSRAETTARVVLAADGLGGTLLADRAAGNPPATIRPGSRIGAGIVVEGDESFYVPGTIFMAISSFGYVGIVRLESGRLDIACALDPAAVRGMAGPGPLAVRILEQTGWPVPRDLAGAAWRGTPPLTRTARRVAGHRLLGLGDATGYVEPFTGEGMAWALSSAVAVAPLAIEAAHCWRAALARNWRDRHHEVVTRRQRLCRVAAEVLRRPWLAGLVVAGLARMPALGWPVVHHLNTPALAGLFLSRKNR